MADAVLDHRYDVAEDHHGDGRLLVVHHPPTVAFPALPAPPAVAERLLAELELVDGVGPVTSRRLAATGVTSIRALAGHEPGRYQAAAAAVCAEWEGGDLAALGRRLRRRLAGRGHLLCTLLAGCVPPGRVTFVDVETLGLAGNVVFLVGLATVGPRGVEVRQLLAPTPADEPALLRRTAEELAATSVLVTYNGTTADLPWLRARAFYHGLGVELGPDRVLHLDLVFGTRRRYVLQTGVLPDARLPTVQAGLLEGRRPTGDVPSAAVPALYQRAVATRRLGLLVPVLEHNRSDLHALVPLLGRLAAEAIGGSSALRSQRAG
jgi:uncharacterized protein YprB with RNaseH-like and TPR domain